jgi:pSer/pThr/pTyr-binding forkhead associated (FHA) protein
LIVGRSPSSGLMLEATEVSRAHCRLVVVDDAVLATDLGSTNGTFVDGRRITQPTLLTDGAVMQIGPYRVVCAHVAEKTIDGTLRIGRQAADDARQRAGRRREAG